jgi:uncharacterized protein with FMN-binding domain
MEETAMSKSQPTRSFSPARTIKKFFVSGFVIFTFVAYALHERFANPDGATDPATGRGAAVTQQALASPQVAPTAAQMALATPALPSPVPTAAPSVAQTAPETSQPTPVPTAATSAPATVAHSQYKDGQFTGDTVDAFYGLVRVQATIQSGKIADVQFLEYPNDRRTSIRINNIAMPYLTTEAIQAQSAEVDIISGATLTSEAFIQSLQSALESAKAQT